MNSTYNEKRRFDRIFHDASTYLTSQNSKEIECQLIDLSLNGCLVLSQSASQFYQVKAPCNICITLADDLSIKASAHIAFIGKENHIGLQFDDIDIDSITTLRRLVELNIGDSLILERNLHSLGSVKDTNIT